MLPTARMFLNQLDGFSSSFFLAPTWYRTWHWCSSLFLQSKFSARQWVVLWSNKLCLLFWIYLIKSCFVTLGWVQTGLNCLFRYFRLIHFVVSCCINNHEWLSSHLNRNVEAVLKSSIMLFLRLAYISPFEEKQGESYFLN